MTENLREPCPYRITKDFGGAFSLGCVGGSVVQSLKGFRNAPEGLSRRLNGSISAIKYHVPRIGGNFAVWGGMFSILECSIGHLRNKDDLWNSVLSGAAASGVMSARKGPGFVIGNALVGGFLMALIELTSILSIHFATATLSGRKFSLLSAQLPGQSKICGNYGKLYERRNN